MENAGAARPSNDIAVIYGNTPRSMVKELLSSLRVEEEIEPDTLIGIKPNLVVAKPASSGATTSPEIVAGMIEYLQSKGFRNLVILEGSWVGARTREAFRICGYEALSRRYNVPLIDLQQDASREMEYGGMRIRVCESVLRVGYLINVPVLKGHCQTNMTCALKNMKGCIPDSEKRKFHTMGLHKPIAYLNKILKQNLVIVDGLTGDLDFEEGGNPVVMNRMFAGRDPVLIDAFGARLLGFDLSDVPYIKIAAALGVGNADAAHAVIRELNKDTVVNRRASTGKVRQLAKYIEEDCACSACYGTLIHALGRLEERGELHGLIAKCCIGQHFRGKKGDGIGIGACTSGFAKHVAGCPPTAKDILAYLEENGF